VDGRATGIGHVYLAFDNVDVAKEAMNRCKSTIVSHYNYVELFLFNSNNEERTNRSPPQKGDQTYSFELQNEEPCYT